MNISLEQAIEIHARVLAHRHGDGAPATAREHARRLERIGDRDGREVWLRVADFAAKMATEDRERDAARALQ